MRVTISKKQVDKIFENAKHQQDYVIDLYRLVFRDWEQIESIEGHPKVSRKTSEYIFEKAKSFDKKHHDCLAGGLWFSMGFSTCDKGVKDWEVDLFPCSCYMKGTA